MDSGPRLSVHEAELPCLVHHLLASGSLPDCFEHRTRGSVSAAASVASVDALWNPLALGKLFLAAGAALPPLPGLIHGHAEPEATNLHGSPKARNAVLHDAGHTPCNKAIQLLRRPLLSWLGLEAAPRSSLGLLNLYRVLKPESSEVTRIREPSDGHASFSTLQPMFIDFLTSRRHLLHIYRGHSI